MKFWIKTLIENESARLDFVSYLATMESLINSKIVEALYKNDPQTATGLAYELKVYATLKQAFRIAEDNLKAGVKS